MYRFRGTENVQWVLFDDESDRKKLDKVIEKFEEYTIGRINETFERYRFNSRNQEPSEGIDAYISALRNLAKTCNFGSLHDSLVRDRIVFGVQGKHMRQKLLQERKLTLEKCIVEDPTCGQGRSWRRDRKWRNDRNEQSQDNTRRVTKTCHFCGNKHEMNKKKCPAWGKQCQKCNGRNHFASVCKKDRRINHIVEDETDTDSDVEFITSICLEKEYISQVSDNEYPKEIYAEMIINGSSLSFQVDCGASVNILPLKYVGDCAIKPSKKSLRMWNGTNVTPVGSTRVIVRNPKNHKRYSIEFVVVRETFTPLIGARAAQQMKLIKINNSNFITASPTRPSQPEVHQLTSTEKIVQEYADIFEREVGSLPGTVHLETEDNASPVIIPPRRVPTALKTQLKEELDKYVKLGVLAQVEEPTPWVSSLAIATKKSGALRICIDPKHLNAVLKRETYQLPILDDMLPELAQAKVFSTVDLKAGYWHCVLDEESSLLTTFSTPYGRYWWLRLPFGLSVSSEIFQKRENQALEGLEGILDITDDILIYGVGKDLKEATEDHDRHLKALLQRCRERGMALNKDKLKLR